LTKLDERPSDQDIEDIIDAMDSDGDGQVRRTSGPCFLPSLSSF
jgi:Ca2+-binding EF-hand superfamily protein